MVGLVEDIIVMSDVISRKILQCEMKKSSNGIVENIKKNVNKLKEKDDYFNYDI